MIEIKEILEGYKANLLAFPDISNAEIIRDEFISSNGNVFYGNKKVRFAPISFTIEFKGTDKEIRKNRNKLSKLLELNTISFDGEVFYKGRFLEKGVKKYYYHQVVDYDGKAIPILKTQSYDITLNENNIIENNGDYTTPVRIILNGNASDISITGFDDIIQIKSLNGEMVIDSERGIKGGNRLKDITISKMPTIEDEAIIKVTGNGNFTCRIEFEGRVIC